MTLIKTYKEFTTVITIYNDSQMNEYMYEDGELVYTNIFNVETNYDSYGNKIWQLVMTLWLWQVVMTKRHSGILSNYFYQLNN